MTDRQRKIITFFGLFVAVCALILVSFGFYIREVGTGNPVGSVSILLGCALVTGDSIAFLLVSSQKANRIAGSLLFIVLAVEILALAAVISYLRR